MITFTQELVGIGAVVAFLGTFYGPWQWISTDIARQLLFEKRDAIFDMAADGRLKFDSREYAILRSTLQATIRWAHNLTLPRMVTMSCLHWARGELGTRDDLSQAIERIHDFATRAEVRKLVNEAYTIIVVMLIVKSLWALALFPLLIVTFFCRGAFHGAVRRASPLIRAEVESAPHPGRPVAA
jgi:hypothetical protein